MLGELLGMPAPIADVVSKPRFLSPAAGGEEPRFRNRDMLGELPGKLVPVADVVSKPRFLSPAAGGKEPRSRALWVLEIATCPANYQKSQLPLQTWFLNHGSSRLRREERNRDLEIATCSANCRESPLPLQTWFLNHGSSRLRREERNRDSVPSGYWKSRHARRITRKASSRCRRGF